ncbi:reverse transcriptase domain-containing protein [Tanacetum coccineum]
MLRAFHVSLIRAASRWLRNQPSGLITTWEVLKTKFLNKYCPPARTTKKMEEVNTFQKEADESLFCAWETFKEMLATLPCHLVRPGNGKGENQALCRGGRSASKIGSLRVGDDGSGGDGILGRGDDKGDSKDGGSDGGAGAASHAFMCAIIDGGKEATSSSSKGSVFSDGEARSAMAGDRGVGDTGADNARASVGLMSSSAGGAYLGA